MKGQVEGTNSRMKKGDSGRELILKVSFSQETAENPSIGSSDQAFMKVTFSPEGSESEETSSHSAGHKEGQ